MDLLGAVVGAGGIARGAGRVVVRGVILLLLVPIVVVGAVIVREGIEATAYVRVALEQGGLEELMGRLPDRLENPIRWLAVTFFLAMVRFSRRDDGLSSEPELVPDPLEPAAPKL